MKSQGPKVLILDIETAPILARVWDIWQQNVGLSQIEDDWFIMSWAAKWWGTKPAEAIHFDQRDADPIEDDHDILKELWTLLNEADIVVTQNGKSFDIPKIFARMLHHGMKPPSSFKQIDTKVIAAKTFKFTSNKLEYLSDKLAKKYKKLKSQKFPGYELWRQCLLGNVKAWDEMKRYNIRDVLATEEVYDVLVPWAERLPNFSLYSDNNEHRCRCGSTELQHRGYAYTNTGKFQRYSCNKCGAWFRDRENLLSKTKLKALRVNITP